MKVRAKFICGHIEQVVEPNVETKVEGLKRIHMNAVYSTTGENADFATATPYGSLQMNISENTPAYDSFEAGKEYYLDITLAD